MDISVVRDMICILVLENFVNLMFGGMVLKRKVSGFLSRVLFGVKWKKVLILFGCIVVLDLNFFVEENEVVLVEMVISYEEIVINIGVFDLVFCVV